VGFELPTELLMKLLSLVFASLCLFPRALAAQEFSCPTGQSDMMKYFVMSRDKRTDHFLKGQPNPIFTTVFPDRDFAATGYWFWLKSPKAHGFDVKSFDQKYVYMRATELEWKDNTSFKRFERDLPIAARCATEGEAGPEIKVIDTRFQYFASCHPYKSSNLKTAVNDLDAPVRMDVGGNLGELWTRVLHYHYNCDREFQNCRDEEKFYLGNGYGLWKWEHFRNGEFLKSALMNDLQRGKPRATLPCEESYRPSSVDSR
jgi:hypothetical protein